jgi:hypothetical protein
MADETAIADMLESFKPGEGIEFEVLVDVWPEAALKGPYTGLEVRRLPPPARALPPPPAPLCGDIQESVCDDGLCPKP